MLLCSDVQTKAAMTHRKGAALSRLLLKSVPQSMIRHLGVT